SPGAGPPQPGPPRPPAGAGRGPPLRPPLPPPAAGRGDEPLGPGRDPRGGPQAEEGPPPPLRLPQTDPGGKLGGVVRGARASPVRGRTDLPGAPLIPSHRPPTRRTADEADRKGGVRWNGTSGVRSPSNTGLARPAGWPCLAAGARGPGWRPGSA